VQFSEVNKALTCKAKAKNFGLNTFKAEHLVTELLIGDKALRFAVTCTYGVCNLTVINDCERHVHARLFNCHLIGEA